MKHGFSARLNPILDSEVSQYPYLTMSSTPVPALIILDKPSTHGASSQYIWVLRRLANKTHMHPPLRQQISDLVTSILSVPRISANLTSSSITDMKAFIRISRVLFRPFMWRAELLNANVVGRQYDQRRKLQEALEQEEWYATVEDVQRIWTNVIRHRIGIDHSQECGARSKGRGVHLDYVRNKPESVLQQDEAISRDTGATERGMATEADDDAVAGILNNIMRRCTM